MATNLQMQARAMKNYAGAFERALVLLCQKAVEVEQNLISTPYPPASFPYQPPHLRTGQLRSSIGYEIIKDERGLVGRIGARAAHPRARVLRFLEKGTVRMLPRPSLQTMLEKLRDEVVPELKRELRVLGRLEI